MIELILTDSTTTLTLPILEVPLTEIPIEKSTDVENLLGDVKTYFVTQKRQWVHTWSYLSQSNYDALRAFYDRQLTLFEYPLLTIDYYTITNVPVRMTINQKDIYNNCGGVKDVQVTFRETAQLPQGS